MRFDKLTLAFFALMATAGVVVGVLAARVPGVGAGPVPPLVWIVLVALLFDVATSLTGGRMLTMRDRGVGVIGGGLLQVAVAALLRA